MAAALTPDQVDYQKSQLDETQQPMVVGVSILLIVFTTLCVGLRFIARGARKIPLGWDDAFCAVALVLTISMCVINLVSVQFGLGKHLLAADPSKGYKILQPGWFLSLDYTLTHWFIKIAILFTYIRIFTLNMKLFRYAVYFVMAWVTAWTLGLAITMLTECNGAEVSTSALDTVADFFLLILPVLVLSQLQLSLKKKLGVIAIFAVGIFAFVAGILRLTSTLTVIATGTDSTWDTVPVYVWTAVEAAVALMCACFPIVGPLFPMATEKLQSLTNGTSKKSLLGGMSGWSRKDKQRLTRDQYQMHSKQQSSKPWDDGVSVSKQPIISHTKSRNVPDGSVLGTDSFTIVRSPA